MSTGDSDPRGGAPLPNAGDSSGQGGQTNPLGDTHSRRQFLRGAVISAAAVATAGAVGVATVRGIQTFSPVALANPSGNDPNFQICFTDSMYEKYGTSGKGGFDTTDGDGDIDIHGGHANPGTFFLWFTAVDLAPGTYSMTVSPSLTDTSTPFNLHTSGNNAFLFDIADKQAQLCPTADPAGANQIGTSHTVQGLFGLTGVTIPRSGLSGNSDLQLKVHIDYNQTADSTTVFTVQLHQGTQTGPVLGSASITIVADSTD